MELIVIALSFGWVVAILVEIYEPAKEFAVEAITEPGISCSECVLVWIKFQAVVLHLGNVWVLPFRFPIVFKEPNQKLIVVCGCIRIFVSNPSEYVAISTEGFNIVEIIECRIVQDR